MSDPWLSFYPRETEDDTERCSERETLESVSGGYYCTLKAGILGHFTNEHMAGYGNNNRLLARWPYINEPREFERLLDAARNQRAQVEMTTDGEVKTYAITFEPEEVANPFLYEGDEIESLKQQLMLMATGYHMSRLGSVLFQLQAKRVAEEIQWMWLEQNEEAREILQVEWTPRNPFWHPRKTKEDVVREFIPRWNSLRSIMERLAVATP